MPRGEFLNLLPPKATMAYPCYKLSSSHDDRIEEVGDMHCPCGDATNAEVAYYQEVKFWLEAVAVPAVGGVGLIGNVAAIPVLLSRRLANLFHRTLAVLAIIDNVFIACDILESFRRFGPKSTNSTIVGSFCSTHIYATPYVLRPLCSMAMVASIYMTVAIALERYIAVSRPISTYVGGGDNEETMAAWLKVLKYVGPVILLSVAINISTFFEFFIKWETVTLPVPVDANQTAYSWPKMCPHLRLDEDYILYYTNLFRNTVTGLLPLILLCLLNYLVLKHLMARRRLLTQTLTAANSTSLAATDEPRSQMRAENRQTHILFGVAAIFILGHSLRIGLNIQELHWLVSGRGGTEGATEERVHRACEQRRRDLLASPCFDFSDSLECILKPESCGGLGLEEDMPEGWDAGCGSSTYPLWFLIAGSVKRLLIIASVSANLIVYCATSAVFRKKFFGIMNRRRSRRRPPETTGRQSTTLAPSFDMAAIPGASND